VVIMHGDTMSYATSFEKALKGLYSEEAPTKQQVEEPGRGKEVDMTTMQVLIEQANQAFRSYLNLQEQMEFERASRKMRKLRDTLQQLYEQAEESGSGGKTKEETQ